MILNGVKPKNKPPLTIFYSHMTCFHFSTEPINNQFLVSKIHIYWADISLWSQAVFKCVANMVSFEVISDFPPIYTFNLDGVMQKLKRVKSDFSFRLTLFDEKILPHFVL